MKNVHQIREISTLSFNERVLQEAETTESAPERLKFLGIFSSNMDEFFKVRVASITAGSNWKARLPGHPEKVLNDKARGLDERFPRGLRPHHA